MEFRELLEQGEALSGEGLLEDALSRFEEALSLAPEEPEVVEAMGRAFFSLERFEEAEASFLAALELDNGWAAPHLGLSSVAAHRERPFRAVHHMERAIEADPEWQAPYVELGRYYGALGEGELARATFERWMGAHPEDGDMLVEAGLMSFDAADYERALGFFERALGVGGEEEQINSARTFRANSLDMLGRYREAVEGYERVISEAPGWWEAHANLGICHARNGHLVAAETALRNGLSECPGSPEIRDELAANLLHQNKNLREALSLAREAVDLGGEEEMRHLHTLGEVHLAFGDTREAEAAYREILGQAPSDAAAHLELGLICEGRGETGEAEGHYIEALEAEPGNPRVLHAYAGLYYSGGDLGSAEELLRRAVDLDPGYFPALSGMASVRARSGDYRGSLEYLERAVAAGEDNAGYFKSAPEFAPLWRDPGFRSLISRMEKG